MKYADLIYFLSGGKNIKIKDAGVINKILITVVRFKTKSVCIMLVCFSSIRLRSQGSFNREFVALYGQKYRVLKCDVIKMKFLKLWDLSRYFERTMPRRPTCQKLAFRGKLSLRS